LQDFKNGTLADPKDADLFYNYGTGLGRDKQDYQGADKVLTEAILLDPNHANAYCNRGIARMNLQRYEEALGDYKRTLDLDPHHLKALMNRGGLNIKLGLHEGVMRDYMGVLRLLPKDSSERRKYADDMFVAAHKLHKAGKYPAAIEGFEFLSGELPILPFGCTSAYNAACGRALSGEPDKALDWLEKTVSMGLTNRALVEKDPDLDSLRTLPRYKTLLEALERTVKEHR
jgi:tetratricopeptide (TPR) repeat protein